MLYTAILLQLLAAHKQPETASSIRAYRVQQREVSINPVEQLRRHRMVRNGQTSYFIAGIILMGLGGLFLIAQLLGGTFWAYFWPYLIIVAGLTFLAGMVYTGRGAGGLAIPGTIITTVGVILFFQNLLGWWQSWSYA